MSDLADVPRSGRDFTAYFRFGRRAGAGRRDEEKKLPWRKQLVLQAILLLITATVLFPIVWIFGMSINADGGFRPEGLNLIPTHITFDAYQKVLAQPTSNNISFLGLMLNSLKIALISSAVAVGVGVTAAYAFSRLKFAGREVLMIAILGVLMLPAVATIIPLYVFLNQFRFEIGDITFNLRASILGVCLAVISAQLPFAIWNLKGYLDTIPRDLRRPPLSTARPRTRRSRAWSCRSPRRPSP
jgi:arabinogalactan oligomer/maltooligosaccharide transport system permease protein